MTRITALVAAVVASLALAGAAQAHYGNLWFTSAGNLRGMIVDKYTNVETARCTPKGDAHRLADQWGTLYDHFLCAVRTYDGNVCTVVAHITGPGRRNIVLTSHRYRGCSSHDLWG